MSISGAPGHPGALQRGTTAREGTASGGFSIRRLWDRELDRYPASGQRYFLLALTVVSTIVLYYEFYVQASVTSSILPHFGMTWPFFVYVIVVGNLLGAFGSLGAGIADRWGRANLVVYGLLITGLITLIGLPQAPNLWVYAILYSVLAVVEGVILVATPALMRDFSPQLGRATAMGFWTMGPVIASLTVALIASHTLGHLHAWQDQFVICGIVGLVVFGIALFGLRELSPGLRDQLMVSIHDRALIEARAKGLNVEESIKHPWRQMVKANIVVPSAGIGIFLIIYYTLIAFLPVFMVSIFGYTQARSNLLGNWIWAFNAGALVVAGIASDWAKVRKPFMVVGSAIALSATALFAIHTTQADTGYYTFVWILCLLAVGLGFTFSTWLAAFTETVEDRNPALTATGLAVWGWILRIAVAASLFVLPYVVTSMTPIVDHGARVQAIVKQYPQQIATLSVIDKTTLAKLSANPGDTAAVGTAVSEISKSQGVSTGVALQRLVAVGQVPKSDLAYVAAHGAAVQHAASVASKEWQRWWWICFGAEAIFLPTVWLLRGRWRPKDAKADEEAHEKLIQSEMASLGASANS